MFIFIYILLASTLLLAAAWLAASWDDGLMGPGEGGPRRYLRASEVAMAEGVNQRPLGLPP